MKFLVSADTDIGISKQTNQDSLCVRVAEIPDGQILMAILCDGMGGLAKGELASATVIRAFSDWFERELPWQVGRMELPDLARRWNEIIVQLNGRILEHARRLRTSMGTTFTGLLAINNRFMYVHVGDSRFYKITRDLAQVTEDQTVVSRDVRRGVLSEQDAKTDPRRNVLLQCVGAMATVVPEAGYGIVDEETVFMLCSDGLYHELTPAEIFESLNPARMRDKASLQRSARRLIDTAKKRNEKDNISVIAVKAL